jgi:hypothetical protein
MYARAQTVAIAMILSLLPATMAAAQTSRAIEQNLQKQQTIQTQMQAVPAYCQAQSAKQRPGPDRSQAIQMCMQQRYQSLSIALQQQKQIFEQIQKTQRQIYR